jgi:NADPH:quinone reductase
VIGPKGVDHIIEVAFAANMEADLELLNMGGSIATYATDRETPQIPFWPMVFKNTRLFFLGSDDFPRDAKVLAAKDLNAALEAGWSGFRHCRANSTSRDCAGSRTCGTSGAAWAGCCNPVIG